MTTPRRRFIENRAKLCDDRVIETEPETLSKGISCHLEH